MAQQVRATEVCNEPSELTADVYETAGGEAHVIEVPVPRLRPDEISIELTTDTVTISTDPRERSQDSGRKYFSATTDGAMSRVFEFLMDLDTDNVQANIGERHLEGPPAESWGGAAQSRQSRTAGIVIRCDAGSAQPFAICGSE